MYRFLISSKSAVADVRLPSSRLSRYTIPEMVTTGTVREKQIELDEPLDLAAGTRVEVFVRPLPASTSHGVIGLLSEDTELIDAIVEEAMQARETRPWRIENEQNAAGH